MVGNELAEDIARDVGHDSNENVRCWEFGLGFM